MTSQVQQLTLGAFDLFGDGDTWRCETLADGTDLAGNPQPVEVAIQTLIQDGSVSYTEKHDNATISIRVSIQAPDAEALDEGAAALFAELGKPNVLTYEGPLAFGPVAWDVVNSRLERNSDDLAEVRGERYYTVTLTVLPFRRATEETITPALSSSATPTTVTVDDGSSATAWSGYINGAATTPTVSSGAINLATSGAVPGTVTLQLNRSGTIDTSVTKYLIIDWASSGSTSTPSFGVAGDGTALSKVSETVSPTPGYTRGYFQVTSSSVAVLTIQVQTYGFLLLTSDRTLAVDYVGRTNALPGQPRQKVSSIAVGGSVRTPGALQVQHESQALGDVFLCVWPDDGSGYQPMLRPYRTAGSSVTSDTAAVTGNKDDIKAIFFEARVPTARLPRDSYTVYARLRATSSASAAVTVSSFVLVNGQSIGAIQTSTRTVSLTTSYAIVALTRVELPSIDLEGTSPLGLQAIQFAATSSATSVYLDEAWVIGSRSREVLVNCGSGTASAGGPSNRLFLEPSNLITPRPRILRGFSADRSDAFFPPGVGAWRFPEFVPPRVNVMAVTTGADDAAVSFRHYERKAG